MIERAARALEEDIGLDPGEAVDAVRAVLRAIREIDDPLHPVLLAGQCTTGHWQAMIDAAMGEE